MRSRLISVAFNLFIYFCYVLPVQYALNISRHQATHHQASKDKSYENRKLITESYRSDWRMIQLLWAHVHEWEKWMNFNGRQAAAHCVEVLCAFNGLYAFWLKKIRSLFALSTHGHGERISLHKSCVTGRINAVRNKGNHASEWENERNRKNIQHLFNVEQILIWHHQP